MAYHLHIAPFDDWTDGSKPWIISGPCSAENPDQVYQTVKEIVHYAPSVRLLRAGIWKPRTRPNAFEGVGQIGLPWIKEAGKEFGLPVTVEVANAVHVEQALKAGIDVLWIGARTTVNPFQVQEICEALKGVDIPVMVKNPVNPDLDLWIGAMERLNEAGISKLAAIHRGFSAYEKSNYRNRPSWEIPIELRRRIPKLPIICDPSHICGRRDLLQSVAQKAMDLNFDGLMIESHIDPDSALSDAQQQLKPEDLGQLIDRLIIRKSKLDPSEVHVPLNDLRAKIDRIDNYLLELYSERMSIVEEIGDYKRDNNMAIFQAERWRKIVDHALEVGKANGLSEDFILRVFQQIHNESIQHQIKVMSKKPEKEQ